MLSFVYDIADLYKTEITIPAAFAAVKEGDAGIETRVRKACRDAFRETRLLERIVPDIQSALGFDEDEFAAGQAEFDSDEAAPGGLWDPAAGEVAGGLNRGDDADRKPPAREEPELSDVKQENL